MFDGSVMLCKKEYVKELLPIVWISEFGANWIDFICDDISSLSEIEVITYLFDSTELSLQKWFQK